MLNRINVLLASFSIIFLAAGTQVWAGGKASSQPTQCTPSSPQPLPVFRAIVAPVETKPFTLPNGVVVNMQEELGEILHTAIAQTKVFAPFEPAQPVDPCASYIEIRSGVSTYQMNVNQFGITFGYSPSGSNSVITSITGTATLTLGTIAMEFGVWEHTPAGAQEIYPASANSTTSQVNGSVTVNFGTIKVGADYVHIPVIQNAFTKIMTDGMNVLAKSPKLNMLSWQATVTEVLPEVGGLVFDRGLDAGIAPNQTFVVYTENKGTGICPSYTAIAEIHSTQVEPITTQALVDSVLDAQGIKVGDIVLLKAK